LLRANAPWLLLEILVQIPKISNLSETESTKIPKGIPIGNGEGEAHGSRSHVLAMDEDGVGLGETIRLDSAAT
jgi:hypothetical protein